MTYGVDIAIVKEGGKYRLYDYESGHITREMTHSEIEALLSNIEERLGEFKQESEMASLERELDTFAQKNVPEYKKLTESEREAVRETLRRARANGISSEEQILFARIAAKSGLKIVPTRKLPGGNDGRSAIGIDKKGQNGYNRSRKVPPTDEFASNAMQWAYSDKTVVGEQKLFYRKGKWVLLEKSDNGFVEMGLYTDKQRNNIIKEVAIYNETIRESVRSYIMRYESIDRYDMRNNGDAEQQQDGDGRGSAVYQGESDSNRGSNYKSGESSNRSQITEEDGRNTLSDTERVAFYDGKNTVYLDATAPKSRIYSALLGHEVFHRMFKSTKVKKLFMQAWKNIGDKKRREVIDAYTAELKKNKELSVSERISITNEEVAAAVIS